MPDSKDFLVEIGTEELPPRALPALAQAFGDGVRAGLSAAGLAQGDMHTFATPRRLAVRVDGLETTQPERDVERLGPPVRVAFDKAGAPTRAATAFAESCGIEVDEIERTQTPKGERLVYRAREKGRTASELLPDIIRSALDKLPIPKRMRWGAGEAEFVRPVHWVVMLLGSAVVEAEIFGIPAGNETRGHRFHATKPLRIKSPADYESLLAKKGFVVADFATRREMISRQAAETANTTGGVPLLHASVLDEVTALVEWPVAHAGKLDESFLDLPREVLVASLESQQRYFPVTDDSGALKPWFVAISNIESRDRDEVTAGNERVVRPRLADAAFFFDVDKKTQLAVRQEKLKGIVFHHKLGSLYDKTTRVKKIALLIAETWGGDKKLAERAAELAKCDLVTEMVGEFPELQGTMGRYYALHDGEPGEIATAIEEHYRPRHAGDQLPSTATGQAVAVADKLDTIAGIFAAGEQPTGTRDPYGLRRNALGILRIAIESELDLDLEVLIAAAVATLAGVDDAAPLQTQIYDYVMERLRAYYRDRETEPAITTEMFDAVLARRPPRPLDFHHRILAVAEFMRLDEALPLAVANKRIANILRQAGGDVLKQPDRKKLQQKEESDLFDEVVALEGEIRPLLDEHEYARALGRLATIKSSADAFFDHVLVMTDDETLKQNRLALLNRLRRLFLEIADISRLPPPA